MSREFKKTLHIIYELLTFLHACGSSDLQTEISSVDGGTHLTIRARSPHISSEKMGELKKALSLPRQHEVEQEYWGLFGDTGNSGELILTGIMLDSADVKLENDVLTITAFRLH